MKTNTALLSRALLPPDLASLLLRERRRARHGEHRIEVFVNKIAQLFNSMDPSPFHDKDLDPEAEEFIVSRLQELAPHERVSLLVHVNENSKHEDMQHLIETAVHNHFLYRARLKRLELNRLLRQGRTSLIIGLAFLAICLVTSEVLALRQPTGALLNVLRESLTIAGWVAMWRPMQVFLYDWWPLRRVGQIYKKLSRMHVDVRTTEESGGRYLNEPGLL